MATYEEVRRALEQRGLLKKIDQEERLPKGEIRGLTCDSREAGWGTLFICKGAAFRPGYLQSAADLGAAAYVGEEVLPTSQKLPGLIVTDIRKAMAAVSAVYYGYEPGKPILTGITGTKGKTTTAWYLKAMLDCWQQEQGGRETGLISTVANYDGRDRQDAVMTTPEAPTIHKLLSRARQEGVSYVTMEVSSQGLKYKRVRELSFQVGIFLNISEDHISPKEHIDFEDYFNSKLSIFRQSDTACVNLDASYADRILKAARKAKHIVTFGKDKNAMIRYENVQILKNRIRFHVVCDRFSQDFELGMRGSFNIENAMAAIAAAYVYKIPVSCIREALRSTSVPGRMEEYRSRDGKICGIVDFAHNWLSFEKVYDAAFQEYGEYSNIITVFGCPGGKALNRRRELGLAAGLFSDHVCITTDDPGCEDPNGIAEEIREYTDLTGCGCTCIPDRKAAVSYAMELAKQSTERTLILLLGRGCEKYQNIRGQLQEYPSDPYLMRQAVSRYDREKERCSEERKVSGGTYC